MLTKHGTGGQRRPLLHGVCSVRPHGGWKGTSGAVTEPRKGALSDEASCEDGKALYLSCLARSRWARVGARHLKCAPCDGRTEFSVLLDPAEQRGFKKKQFNHLFLQKTPVTRSQTGYKLYR